MKWYVYLADLIIIVFVLALYLKSYFNWFPASSIILLAIFVSAFIKTKEKISWWTRKRKINFVLVILWIVWLIVGMSIPYQTYAEIVWPITSGSYHEVSVTIPELGQLSYSINYTFTSTGDISAQNTIHVKAVMWGVTTSATNASDWKLLFLSNPPPNE